MYQYLDSAYTYKNVKLPLNRDLNNVIITWHAERYVYYFYLVARPTKLMTEQFLQVLKPNAETGEWNNLQHFSLLLCPTYNMV